MNLEKTSLSTTIDFNAPGKQVGDLRLPFSSNEQPLGYYPIPVAVVNNGAGPTLLLTGATHGDENEGTAALMHLLHELNAGDVKGRVIIIPALNTPAFTAQTRCSPLDNGNLNRAFPGDSKGGPTEMIAHFVEEVLLPECDAVIDFHSGGNASVFAPLSMVYLGAQTVDEISLAMAREFSAPYIWHAKSWEGNTFNAGAVRKNVPMFATELGGGGGINPDMVKLAKDGILRVMRYLGLLERGLDVPKGSRDSINVEVGENGKVYAGMQGLFIPAVKLEQTINPGDLVGTLYSVTEPEREPLAVNSIEEGIVLTVVDRATVGRGELLVIVGKQT